MKKNHYNYLSFSIKSKVLLLTGILWLSAFSIVFAQQTNTVKGVVFDENKATLPGATIQIKGTTTGTTTDLEGKFTIQAPADAKILVISFIGMEPQEVAITSEPLTINLLPSSSDLSEVVVVGYGTKKKSLVTGSISSIKADELKTTSSSRADQAIQGKTAGVMVLPTSGSPGAGTKIKIRGTNSNSNSNPLFIVDGMKTGDINNIDPNDIESMEVLKDAASSAIYGTEGANGVILITTKSGKAGKGQVNYDFQFGFQSVRTDMEMMDTTQYKQYMSEAGLPTQNRFDANTNWLDEVFQTAPMQKHHLSFSGGNEKTVYMVSGSYLTQDGVVGGEKANYSRYTTRLNLKSEVKEWLEVGGNVSFSHSNQKNVGQDDEYRSLVNSALLIDPFTPVTYNGTPGHVQTLLNEGKVLMKDEDGYYYGLTENVSGEMSNPLATLQTYHNTTEQDKLMGTGYATIKPFKGFAFTSRIGLDLTYQNQHQWTPLYYFSTESQNGTTNVTDNLNQYNTWLWENFATYTKDFGDHSFTALAGYSAQEYKGPVYTLYSAPMVAEGDPYAYQGATTSDLYDRTGGVITQNTMASMFGRVSYSFKNRYLLEASVRRDGASVFPTDSKYAVFPAFSAGWVLSNEDFFKSRLISYFKFRASWGSNGSKSNLPGNEDKELWTLAGIKYPDPTGTYQSGAQISKLVNKELLWERTEMADIGIDMTMLNNKITFTADWYNKNTKNLIALGTFPMSTGGGMPFVNAGTVNNKGFEFELGYRNQDNEFKYGGSLNLSTLKNEVTALDVDAPVKGANVRGYDLTWFEEGEPIWYFKGYKTDGIFNDEAEADAYNAIYGTTFQAGDPIVVDVNADEKITPSDQTKIGSPHPSLLYGGNVFMAYKGWDFNLSFQGVSGNDIFMAWYRTDRALSNKPAYFFEDRWTADNQNASFVRADNTSDYVYRSDLMISNGSYLRIKQIQLGYTLANSLTSKIGIGSLRAYISLDDYFTISSYKGLDPEAGSTDNARQGVDKGLYPISAKIMFGLSASF
ncbi:MAG: TonB-dependent receptor [Bacteroidales bacterium]|nr:TonB-dependent receptor [Bacteroidales bacterium]